jgi:tripartite-type tricarboxylate transporter receptor subunit TctC
MMNIGWPVAIAFAGALAVPAGTWAQDKYPSRPIRLVIPFAPGGGSDVTARLLGPRIAGRPGQPVVIDNRPAASGVVGADIVAKAVPAKVIRADAERWGGIGRKLGIQLN